MERHPDDERHQRTVPPGPSVAETKAALRAACRAARRALAATRDLAADGAATSRALTPFAHDLPPASTVLSYEALPTEPRTDPVHAALQAAGHRVLVPITLADRDLDWCLLGDPARAPLGRDAARTAALVIAPGLAVDAAGTRLGQGGGSYDRALARVPAHALVLTLLHPGELAEHPLPREPHDRPVDGAITATATRLTRRAG